MASRAELQAKLIELLGSENVYFQPPESMSLQFPCIIYSLDRVDSFRADDAIYATNRRYTVTLVRIDPEDDYNGETGLIDTLLTLKYCSYDRRYIVDGLYHDVFTLYF